MYKPCVSQGPGQHPVITHVNISAARRYKHSHRQSSVNRGQVLPPNEFLSGELWLSHELKSHSVF